MECRHVVVRGRVQGVGFRWYVCRRSERLEVRGWVRNRRDGSVEAWGEGDAADIEAWLKALEDGPPGARVEGIEVRTEVAVGHGGFEQRGTV